jgi:hypothetical protein
MSARDDHAEIPPVQNFHPEFGYLCPSPRLRRKVRSAMVTVLAAMAIAAGTLLALVPQLARPPGEQSALSVAAVELPSIGRPADEGRAGDRKAIEGEAAAMAPSTAVTARSASAREHISCDDLSGSFLAPQCKFGKAGKSRITRSARAARAASHLVATIPIGRTDASPQAEPQRAVQPRAAVSRPAPAAESAPAAVATNANPGVPLPEKPAAPAKKPVKTAHKHAPSRDVASAYTMGSTPLPGFGPFGGFHQSPHGGNGSTGSRAWAMSW